MPKIYYFERTVKGERSYNIKMDEVFWSSEDL